MTEQVQVESNVSDEIDLKDLLRSIIDTRVFVVISLLLVSIVFWVAQIVLNFAQPEVYRYESRIDLIFEGVQANQYPNGSPFALADIVSPVVLNSVYDAYSLADYSSRNAFAGSFSVTPYTPDREFILTRYQGLLANKDLNPSEIQELQKELEAELAKAASLSATLSYAKLGNSKIPTELIHTVLQAVPREWSRHMINDKGVERHDVQFYSASVVNEELVRSLDYLIGFEIILDRLGLLEQNIETLKRLPNGLVVEDDETGLSVSDLERAVLDIRRYAITPLINPIRALGIAKDADNVNLYFQNELTELARSTRVLELKKQNVEFAYSTYAQFDVTGAGNREASAPSSIIPQFGSEFLDRILELSNMGADISYRQALNRQLLDISNGIADSEGERQRIQDLVDSLTIGSASDISSELRSTYEEEIKEQLPLVLKQIRSYFVISNRIYDRVSAEQLGAVNSLYRATDGQIDASVSNSILNMSHIRFYLIICFLVIVVMVPFTMIRNTLKN